MKRPPPFFPSTAWEWLKAIEKDPEKPEAADKAALTRFNGGYMAKGRGRRLCRPLFPGTGRGRAGPVADAGP